MNPQDFVHLHVHSHYSLLEALASPKKLVARAKEQGASALALTDNAVMYSAVEFYKECQKAEIKPIIGLDVYVALDRMTDRRPSIDNKNYRLTLIAINQAGYKNLLKISTAGFLDGFYYRPRVDKELLKAHGEGLIALTGGVKGEIAEKLLIGDEDKAKSALADYQKIFGKENVYLELIHHPDFPRQVEANEKVKIFAQQTGTPMVVTKNIFYLDPSDQEGYEAQLCIQRGRTLDDFRRTNTEDVDLSMSHPQEIIDAFADLPEALENTKKIADRVNFEMDLGHNYLPIFPMPAGMSDNDYLHELAWEGLKRRYPEITDAIKERFEYEYGVMTGMGFASYFIIVQDFVRWAKEQGILVGPGRGSAAGSIIAYALNITDIDPLEYGLLFERFLNPDRISMPDIDMDFADSRRGEVLQYVTEKYGADRVAGIITFGTMMPRAAVRDTARVLGLSYEEADLIAKCVPPPVQGKYQKLADSVREHPDLRDLVTSNLMARRVVELAQKLEGNPRHASQHACGIVIGDVPLVERTALQTGQREDMALVVQYSLNSAEAVGLVKMDFLGLSNLSVIQDALEIIKAVHGQTVDMDNISLDDKKAFELLGRGETTGVFQLESDGMKRYIRDLRPSSMEDIIAMVSLYRPGPMQFIDSFIKRKHGKEKITYEHPLLEDALKATYGIPVYQEQVMQVAKDMAGFTGGEADTLRKAMGKKIAELMSKMKIKFVDGAIANNVDKKIAEAVFQKLEDFAAYGFNKSHAACYATIAYRTAYLKAHFPPEFMAALMNSDIGTIDRITIEVEECERMGIKVLPPDVNESFPGFAVVPSTNNIRWGLSAIKNFGAEVAKALVRERKDNGLFVDLADFVSRVSSKHFNKKSIEALIKSGALDRFEKRSTLIANIDQLLMFNKQAQKDKEQNQVSMFDLNPDISESKLSLRVGTEISRDQILAWERELLGIYVSDHPAQIFKDLFGEKITKCASIPSKPDGEIIKVVGVIGPKKQILTKKKQEPMAFMRIEDTTGPLEVVIFPKIYARVREIIDEGKFVLIEGKVSIRERDGQNEYSILCDKLSTFSEKEIPSVVQMLQDDAWFEDGPIGGNAVGGNAVGAYDNTPVQNESEVIIRLNAKPTNGTISTLRDIFKANPGRERVYLLVESDGQMRKVATEYSIHKTHEVMSEIEAVINNST
ncbi:DNA polymerase III subunit alpha [Candidatus Uhrbacteria bacterium CG_4_9_14_0_2_um_filter_41_50]|uniref:DNA polymerase III subunit alpha n=1 Tax=Candidatus Uhrbacteria bacterium CG_4_9_14_0_2_um_filter_41_50 TaxID=1975031 RepID=A0A2M8EN60_9BACT|nr:MAG: DNA polymerase III subunit alpha [Candidatus Uhrbacteria bacterium CG_4_10_14_3_um_filter_41_21]PIZ55042.1 MAG: DNA polymerase III subunit alpha [Candidatus Uhrbacteria bacterium CG_4_10_14_0_2_um_filter_41_21]PJB84311.1 MAG: DNA polymerase III subunit alpha [Candidatus Uhrbacteria bacterium CG_4_9_14_0_8_um_filter_41_16]PJC24176.1 MAG: DNA polymerase III subunit alpha [Candidatus Uhrbacteria bacterium CG_4_9_14_0_2_um_filter_41_50]PJE75173.1 MAG: DNA polymerase III subunit alpha [Candi